ncbi:DUF3995 domain-containing protein [Mesorhizobium sp. LjNodule214]|uniref:DUF3995 domain-containing protein n=1 Tax=Mesorhizobium sp. LjNodule214 TaxID=3342252 RepID=UPI003ECC9A1A
MILLAFALSFVLLVITVLHVYWGIGGVWPGGTLPPAPMPLSAFAASARCPRPFASFAVAACLGLATLWPMALEGVFASPFPKQGLAATSMLIALVFLGRGIAGFTPWWRRLAPEQPFARLDVRYYSPLCLLIGLGFAVLAIMEFPA